MPVDDRARAAIALPGVSGRLDAADSNITVIKEAAVDVTYPEYNAPRNLGTDAKTAVQAAIDHASTAPRGEVLLPHGAYTFTSSGPVLPDGVSLVAPAFGNGHNANLLHTFNGDLITMLGGGALKNLYLIQNGAFTGAAIKHVSTATPSGFFDFERLVVTDFTNNRGWERDLVLDGTLSSNGVRSIFFRACQFFGASTPGETVVLTKCVHLYGNGFEIIQAPQSVVVCGLKITDNFSEDLAFDGASIDGDISSAAVELTFNGRVRQGRTITCVAGSDHNVFTGDVERAAFVNNGGAKNRVVGNVLRAVRSTKSASQPLVSATLTAITFDGEDFDTDAMHDVVTNNSRNIATRDGWYRIYGALAYAPNPTGERSIVFRKNGVSTYLGGHQVGANSTAGDHTVVSASTTAKLVNGDYVECMGQQVSGGALNVDPASTSVGIPTHFGMERIG